MKKKLSILVLCMLALSVFPGCQRRLTPPGTTSRISATNHRADYYYGRVMYDVGAKTGMNGNTPTTYTVQGGSTVRIVGRYDGFYVAVMPNGQYGLIPINSTNPTSPSPTKIGPVIPPPAGGAPTPGSSGGMNGSSVPPADGQAPSSGAPGTQLGGMTGTLPSVPPAGGTPTPGSSGGMNGSPVPPADGQAPSGGTPGTQPGGTAGTAPSSEASTMINLVNQARSQASLKPLSSEGDITRLAGMKAQDIATKNYFSHTSPTYGSPFDMMKANGVSYLYAGENLAMDQNVQSAENNLMNSPEHKANILNPNYTNIGIGIAQKSDGSKVYVQMFIGR